MAAKNANSVVNASYSYGTNTSTSSSIITYKQSIREWQTIANYAKLKAQAKAQGSTYIPPMNAYRHEVFVRKVPTQMFWLETLPGYPYQQMSVHGCWSMLNFNFQPLPTSTQATLYNRCIGKLGKRMNGNSFNAPIFLAQSHKTIGLITNTATTIAKALKGKRTRKELHNLWLEYRYGWRLMIKDCYDLLVAIHDMRKRGVLFRVDAMCEHTNKGSRTWVDGSQPKLGTGDVITDQIETYEWKHQTKITLYYRDEFGPTMQTLQQFGITNPLYVAWDLVPYSFVVDWFIPVGNYLETLDIFLGKRFESGCVSYILEGNRSSKPTNPRTGYSAWRIKQSSLPVYQSKERFYKREVLSTFPSASLPSVQLNLNASKAIDAIALLRQRFQRFT